MPPPERLAPSGFLNLLTPCSAPCLLAIFQTRSARGVPPSELCSSRAAVRRLRRRYPHDVGKHRQTSITGHQHRTANRSSPTEASDQSVTPPTATSSTGSCSTRESATGIDCLGRGPARSSPGFGPLQGVHPRWNDAAFTESPLMRLPPKRKRKDRPPTGYRFQTRLAGLRRDCRPSWGL